MPFRWVKALIDIDLIPNLFWGILIVILLIPGHGLKIHQRAGEYVQWLKAPAALREDPEQFIAALS